MCPRCTKLTAKENDVCPYCDYRFEKKTERSDILPQRPDSPKPTVPSDSTPSKDANRVWNDLNSLTHWTIIIFILLALLGNLIMGIIGPLIGYYWLGPWAANFAKEHKRNINWAYCYGFLFAFLGCGFYWVYVKVTTDPTNSPHSVYDKNTTAGEWVVLGLSLIFAFFATFSQPIDEGISNIFYTLLGSFLVSLIILYIVYWLITKLFPRSQYWSIVFWILVLVGIPIILLFVAGFFMAMVGSTSNTPVSSIPTVVFPLAPSVLPGNGSFIQSPLSAPVKYSKTIGDWQFTLTSNNAYTLSGKVVGRQEYPATMPNGIIPLDLAVVSGDLISQDILSYFTITMGSSTLKYSYDIPISTGLTEKYIDEHISLNRLVFLNPEIEREVKKAQVGNCLIITGKLVDIRANSTDNAYSITTSTVRNDFYPTGAEVILVESYTPVSCRN